MEHHEIIKLEKRITRKLVKEIFQKKPNLHAEVLDSDYIIHTKTTSNQSKIVKGLLGLDYAILNLYENEFSTEPFGFVILVYGEEVYDLINEYTCNAADLIKETLLYTKSFVPE